MARRTHERLRLASVDRDYLLLSGISAPLQQLLADFAVLSVNASIVLNQPALTLSLLPTLPEDQALLSEHVRMFRDGKDLSGGIMAGFQAVTTIANQIQNAAAGLLPTALRLDQGTTGDSTYDADLAQYRSVLAELSKRTTTLDPDAHSPALVITNTRTALTAFVNSQIKDDTTRFATAVQQAKFSGNIDKLKLQISALQSQISGLNADIAAGATTQILPALEFGFSIGKTVASALTDPGELVLNVGFEIKGQIEKVNEFTKQMEEKNNKINELIVQYRDLVQALLQDEQEMSVLLTIAGHCKTYGESIADAEETLGIVLGQIQLLQNGIDELTLIDSADSPDFFSGQLNTAIAGWKAIADACGQDLTLARNLQS